MVNVINRNLAWVFVAALAGCHSSTKILPMTVAVRDQVTGQPVPRAMVTARTAHFYLPMGSGPIIDPSPPESARAKTDERGEARLSVIADHPVQIIIMAPGYQTLVLDLPRHPGFGGETGWIDAEYGVDPRLGPALEVRFSP